MAQKKRKSKVDTETVYVPPPQKNGDSTEFEVQDYDPLTTVVDEFEKDLDFLLKEDAITTMLKKATIPSLTQSDQESVNSHTRKITDKKAAVLSKKVKSEIMEFDIDFSSDEDRDEMEPDEKHQITDSKRFMEKQLGIHSGDEDSSSSNESESDSSLNKAIFENISDEEEFLKIKEEIRFAKGLPRDEFDELECKVNQLSISSSSLKMRKTKGKMDENNQGKSSATKAEEEAVAAKKSEKMSLANERRKKKASKKEDPNSKYQHKLSKLNGPGLSSKEEILKASKEVNNSSLARGKQHRQQKSEKNTSLEPHTEALLKTPSLEPRSKKSNPKKEKKPDSRENKLDLLQQAIDKRMKSLNKEVEVMEKSQPSKKNPKIIAKKDHLLKNSDTKTGSKRSKKSLKDVQI